MPLLGTGVNDEPFSYFFLLLRFFCFKPFVSDLPCESSVYDESSECESLSFATTDNGVFGLFDPILCQKLKIASLSYNLLPNQIPCKHINRCKQIKNSYHTCTFNQKNKNNRM